MIELLDPIIKSYHIDVSNGVECSLFRSFLK